MRTLYLVHDHPDPPTSGTRVRSTGIATALAEHGPVSLAALDEVDRPDAWGAMCRAMVARRASIADRLWDRARATVRGRPAQLERALGAGGERAFASLLAEYDPELVVLSRPYFGPFIDLARRHGAAVVIDADESLVRAMGSVARSRTSARQRLRAILDGTAARSFERVEYRRADEVWVSSPVERAYFAARLPSTSVLEIPNLAPGATSVRPPAEPGAPEVTGAPEVRGVAFLGTYSYAPNEDAALELIREVMPAIRRRGGPSRLVLIGRDPTEAMARAASGSTDVTITGLVDDPIPLLREAGVLVAPIRAGAGSRVKILEAMCAGVPVVTTHRGLEGLAAVPGREILTAETPDDLANAVVRLAGDPELRGRLVEAAAAFVDREHSQAAVSAAVRDALAARPPSQG